MKAWYDFLKSKDLGDFSYFNDPPNNFKLDAMSSKMPKSLMFIRDFFKENTWIDQYMPHYEHKTFWTNAYMIKGIGLKSVIRIKKERLYMLYKEHLKQFYPSSKVRNCDTFHSEIEKIGALFPKKRQKIRTKTFSVVDLPFEVINSKFSDMYNVQLSWECTEKKPNFSENN